MTKEEIETAIRVLRELDETAEASEGWELHPAINRVVDALEALSKKGVV